MSIDEGERLTKAAKAMAKGSLYIFIGNTSSTVILALASIMVARFLTPQGYGLYCLTLMIPALFLTFTDFGTNSALLKFLPRSILDGDKQKTIELIETGLLFNIAAGSSLSALAFLLSDFMAERILNRSDIGPFVQLSSSLILFQAIVATSNSIFIGHDEAKYIVATSILQATVRLALIFLIVPSLGLFGAVLSQLLSFLLAAILAILFLIRICKTHTRGIVNFNLFKNLISMLRYGLPLYSSVFLISLLTRYQSALLAWYTTDLEIGNYSIAQNFTSFVTILTLPVSTMLLPSFSKLEEKKEDLRKFFNYSIKYTLFITVPACFVVAISSRDLVQLFYGSEYSIAPSYLTIYILAFLYTTFTIVLGNLFTGTGEVYTYLKAIFVKFLASLPLSFILISYHRVFGLIASNIISDLVLLLYAYHKANTRYRVSIDAKGSLIIFLNSFFSATAAFLITAKLSSHSYIVDLLLNGVVFLICYLILSPLTGSIHREDFQNLKNMSSETYFASPIKKVLSLYEHLATSLKILK